MTTASLYADYSRTERTVDAIVHVAGLAFAFVAIFCLIFLSRTGTSPGVQIGLGLYGLGLVSMLGCSALYNFTVPGPRKGLFRRMDHAAIFIMIAGTYSPFSLITLPGTTGILALSCIWAVALAGAAIKMLWPGRFERLSIVIYLMLGWSGLMAIHSLLGTLPSQSLILLAIGGVLYSSGVIFHLSRRLPYHNAIWHVFVLAAVICHFIAVTTATAIKIF